MTNYIKNALRNSQYAMSHREFVIKQLEGLGATKKKANEIFLLVLDLSWEYSQPTEEGDALRNTFVHMMAELPKPWSNK